MVKIVRREEWDSQQDLVRLQREMNRLPQRVSRPRGQRGTRVFPSVIISAAEDKLVVRAEVPGMESQDLEISVSGDTLTIQGTRKTAEGLEGGWYHRRERETGSFSRAIRLPSAVDGDQAEASYEAGVLAISLPLKEPARPKEITVKVVEG